MNLKFGKEKEEVAAVEGLGQDSNHFLSHAAKEALEERERARLRRLRRQMSSRESNGEPGQEGAQAAGGAEATARHAGSEGEEAAGDDALAHASGAPGDRSHAHAQQQQSEGQQAAGGGSGASNGQGSLGIGANGAAGGGAAPPASRNDDPALAAPVGGGAGGAASGGRGVAGHQIPAGMSKAEWFLAQRYPDRYTDHMQQEDVAAPKPTGLPGAQSLPVPAAAPPCAVPMLGSQGGGESRGVSGGDDAHLFRGAAGDEERHVEDDDVEDGDGEGDHKGKGEGARDEARTRPGGAQGVASACAPLLPLQVEQHPQPCASAGQVQRGGGGGGGDGDGGDRNVAGAGAGGALAMAAAVLCEHMARFGLDEPVQQVLRWGRGRGMAMARGKEARNLTASRLPPPASRLPASSDPCRLALLPCCALARRLAPGAQPCLARLLAAVASRRAPYARACVAVAAGRTGSKACLMCLRSTTAMPRLLLSTLASLLLLLLLPTLLLLLLLPLLLPLPPRDPLPRPNLIQPPRPPVARGHAPAWRREVRRWHVGSHTSLVCLWWCGGDALAGASTN